VPAQIIDGKTIAARIHGELAAARRRVPGAVKLASIEVGDSAAADVYVRNQARAAAGLQIGFERIQLPAGIGEPALLRAIEALNDDAGVTGILVQRPLPPDIDPRHVQGLVSRRKDVEGMNPSNMGAILYREPRLLPCTAAAAELLILEARRAATGSADLRGAEIVVIGHSEIVGKPIALLLLHRLATVTVCHVGTRDLPHHSRAAEVLVVAVGKPGLIDGRMIRPGAIVIDIGINRLPDGRVVGDVDFASACDVAGWITPVPGGVGPVTVAMLMRNVLRAAGAEI
jgi:methylenetetrahydrofolate dehydrogenase (NADP+)/methenyltetrahydrofolate cyclohydrolase